MEMEVKLHTFLNSVLGGGELSDLPLGYFPAVPHWIRRCVGPKPVGFGEINNFLDSAGNPKQTAVLFGALQGKEYKN
jgi:hypothetical protein